MTAFLFIGGILAIGTAGACIAANVLRKLSENTADDNANGDWPHISLAFTEAQANDNSPAGTPSAAPRAGAVRGSRGVFSPFHDAGDNRG